MSDNTTNNATDQNPQEDSEFNPWAEQNPSGHWGGKDEPFEKGLTEHAVDAAIDAAKEVRNVTKGIFKLLGF